MKKLALCSGAILAAILVLSMRGPFFQAVPARAGEQPPAPAEEAGGKYGMRVSIDELPPIVLRGVEGLEVSTEVVEFKDAGLANRLRKLPGRTTYGNIRLSFDPVPAGDDLWKWYSDVLAGKIERRKVSITLSRDGQDLRRYNFTEAWPCKWEGPRQDGAGQPAEAERVTITYETIERTST